MGRLEWTVIGLLCLWILPNQVWGQNDRSYVKFNYERQNNFTFAANLDTRYAFTKARYSFDLRLIHTNIYNTSLASKRFVQLYLSSSLKQHYRLTKRLDLASWLETDQYLNNRNQKINLYAGVRYRPYSFLTVTPLLGYAWDERTAVLGQSQAKAQLDQGFTPAIFLESYKEFKDGLSTQTTMFARYKIIQPRRQHDFSLDHSWSKKFKEGVNLNTGARLASHEIDDYQANSVKRIISDSVLSRLGIEYEISPGLSWRSENNLLLFRRFFKFENQVSEIPEENNLTFAGLEIFTSQRVSLVRKKWKAYGNYEFLYSSRQYDLENNVGLNEVTFAGTLLNEKQKDFFKAQHKVDLLFNASLSKRQSFTFQLTNQYLQYDTPSEMNFGDRDELSYLANANWMVRWRRNFFTAFNLSGNYRHYAFLFKEKSQDNYRQRSLRLDFRYGWDIGKRLRIDGDNAIYVTYNVKDFTDFNKTDRSTRNLSTNIRAAYRPSQKVEMKGSFRRKETQQSYLNWAEFSETTLDTNVIVTIEGKARYYFNFGKRKAKLFLEGGYKHFDQTRRFRASMIGLDNLPKAIRLRQITSQTGPLLSLGFRDRKQSTLDLGVWLQAQIGRNRFQVLDTPTLSGQTFYEEELLKSTLRFRPFLTMRLNYYFR